jgi:hypothetical protein
MRSALTTSWRLDSRLLQRRGQQIARQAQDVPNTQVHWDLRFAAQRKASYRGVARSRPGLQADRPFKGAISLCPSGIHRSTRTRPRREITTIRRLIPRLRGNDALESPSVNP